jgi:hypothetical protein
LTLSSKIINNMIRCLIEKKDWALIINLFRILEPSPLAEKRENTYIMAIYAAKQLKKWKWTNKFYNQGKDKIDFSAFFYEGLEEMKSDLTEEEAKKFISNK